MKVTFQLGVLDKLYVDSLDQRVQRIDISDSEESCKRARSDEEVLRMGKSR